MGRHGKKKRSLLNGRKKATPRPASVNASKKPCEAAARNATNSRPARAFGGDATARERTTDRTSARRKAKARECENPRWPSGCAYGIPKRNATTSKSGRAASRARLTASLGPRKQRGATVEIAAPVNACVNAL